MKYSILAVLALAATGSPVLAQKSQKAAKIQFRTLCTEQVADLDNVTVETNLKGVPPKKIILYNDLSPVVEAAFKTPEVTFYSEKTNAQGNKEQVPAGKATPSKATHQLFLFTPAVAGKGELPYHVQAFDDDEKTFPMGKIRVVNQTGQSLRFKLGEEQHPAVPAGEAAQIPQCSKPNEYNMYPVIVERQKKDSEEWEQIYTSNWKASDKRREIVVLTTEPDTDQLVVRLFSDVPPWVKSK
jgi:hypothetical protein